jgi:hypothetical protein
MTRLKSQSGQSMYGDIRKEALLHHGNVKFAKKKAKLGIYLCKSSFCKSQ